MTKHYATIDGIKRAANKRKKKAGITLGAALDIISREAGFPNFHEARETYLPQSPISGHSITIYEFWSDRAAGTRGNENRTFVLPKPLIQMVNSNNLAGYLGGSNIPEDGVIIGYGDSRNQEQARFEICRMARALQFMAATGLRPSRGGRCYPKGDQRYRPPGADHDKCWYDPVTRKYLLTEEPYPGRHEDHAAEREAWKRQHGWETVRVDWGSIYGLGTELYLTAKAGGFDLTDLTSRLSQAPAPFDEQDWSSEPPAAFEPFAKPPINVTLMSDEMAAALRHQKELDLADAGSQTPELNGNYRGVDIESRWDLQHEIMTMRGIVDAMPDALRHCVASIWCDSRAEAWFAVTIADGLWHDDVEVDVRDILLMQTRGFNGLTVSDHQNHKAFDPEWDWPEEALEYAATIDARNASEPAGALDDG